MQNNEIKPDTIAELDSIAKQALATLEIDGAFQQTFAMADAMMQLRDAITPAMMQRFMGLQNTRLGFMTDRNPRVKNRKTGEFNQPYPAETVKECVIEATLRGVRTVGNHFNIIAHNCYLTLEGYQYKLKVLPGLTELKVNIAVPRIAQNMMGAIVDLEATWKYKGVADSLKASIAAKGDEYAGADSYVGKAQRKFLKRIYERITGTSDPDGEADVEAAQISDTSRAASESAPKFGKELTESTAEPTQQSPPVEAPQGSDAGETSSRKDGASTADKTPAQDASHQKTSAGRSTAQATDELFAGANQATPEPPVVKPKATKRTTHDDFADIIKDEGLEIGAVLMALETLKIVENATSLSMLTEIPEAAITKLAQSPKEFKKFLTLAKNG